MDGLVTDAAQTRCWWCGSDEMYVAYHDDEWGRPVVDDTRLFEKICLEGFQAGLSWITILRKRSAFRKLFHGFEIEAVAEMTEADVERLLEDASIIRHRGKIEATINNAKQAILLREEFGSLAAYFWGFEPQADPPTSDRSLIPSVTDESKQLSRDLRKRGWKFVGPTTCYAFMQAMGMVNDHLVGCDWWEIVDKERAAFVRPDRLQS